ncbi:hypothetical protein [Phascolarctobacterium sp.]
MELKSNAMFNLIRKIKQWYQHRKLIKQGVLIPIESYEEYTALVKEAKAKSTEKVFTNCYMLPAEIKRLIYLKNFYLVKTESGLVFADDEGGYYYLFLYVDMSKPLILPPLEKDILVENVYYDGRKTEIQCKFEEYVQNAGCVFVNTYNAITDCPQLKPEKYWKKLEIFYKSLAKEGKKITQPTEKQLKEFELVYRESIDKFVQKRYTKKERKKQRKLGYLHCIDDEKGNIYAIAICKVVHGGAIATLKDYQGGIYAPGLLMYTYKDYYESMPQEPEAQKEYMRSKGIGGWIAVDNIASWKIHKMMGMTATGKSMNQFVVKTTM